CARVITTEGDYYAMDYW
nr:immunoglobulin heavy chain junction region [Mus musculus]MBK4185373.1 immunoglobulin heavy chain junction region [Mus musculus]MBK4185374.1 immunoglobulin heavy chain junction region [Mus musculus]MBK4185375.1 immunoglobulin heavy chain junction region [Mus musculus]